MKNSSSIVAASRRIRNRLIQSAIIASIVAVAPSPARADSPAAGIAVGIGVGVVSGLIANAIYDYATSDSGSGTTTTTTTETTTTTTTETTTTTTTTTQNSTAAPDTGQVQKTPTPTGFSQTAGPVRRVGGEGKGYLLALDRVHNTADVLTQHPGVEGLQFKVERKIKTVLKRKAAPVKAGTRMDIQLTLRDLYLSTRDIPKTQGRSKLSVSVTVNGKSIYVFSAELEQGRKPIVSDKAAAARTLKNASDILAIDEFVKKLDYEVEAGRTTDEIVVTLVSEGTGRRLGKSPG